MQEIVDAIVLAGRRLVDLTRRWLPARPEPVYVPVVIRRPRVVRRFDR